MCVSPVTHRSQQCAESGTLTMDEHAEGIFVDKQNQPEFEEPTKKAMK
jgi:hypothetical protein